MLPYHKDMRFESDTPTGEDGRIIFAIPCEAVFRLIGTTDADHDDPNMKPVATEAEQDFLVAFANQYFEAEIARAEIVWTYSGVRPISDDGAKSRPTANLRKTRFRNSLRLLAVRVIGRRGCPCRVGISGAGNLKGKYLFLTESCATRFMPAYGTLAYHIRGDLTAEADMGPKFGASLTAREIDLLMANEYAQTAEDMVLRRSKLGLRLMRRKLRQLITI